MSISFHFLTLFVALLIDAIIGDPDWLWRKMSHPVVWMGHLINRLDQRLNRPADNQEKRRQAGLFTLIILIGLGLVVGVSLQFLVNLFVLPWVLEALIVAIFLSGRSLHDHVERVAVELEKTDLVNARIAVAKIVGRDPEKLDRSDISRASIESLAENFSDGVIAPALWFLVAGLPGVIVYKMVNTADSMIGHKTIRHRDFGRATAQFDDLINLPASRISAVLCIFGAALRYGLSAARKAVHTIRNDATKHRSPNAGWPEAAMAGALDIALSGPRSYEGEQGKEPWINVNGRRQLDHEDIKASLYLYITSLIIFAGLLVFSEVI